MPAAILSDLLGWASIACWLGAQFPQVVENARRRSCEGLALPFLLNWLLGDITNLVGCVLTHQLPFQTILASYFCSVDAMLFSQYFYYGSLQRKRHSSLLEPGTPRHTYGYGRVFSPEREHEREHYRELSSAATNVAIAAALAASEEEERAWPWLPPASKQARHRATRSTSFSQSEAAEAEDEVDEDALAALADSFHSELGGATRKRVSWSQERHAPTGVNRSRAGSSATLSPLTTLRSSLVFPSPAVESGAEFSPEESQTAHNAGSRGRPRQRQLVETPVGGDEYGDVEAQEGALTRTVSTVTSVRDRKSSRASRKNVGLVFLGVWALFGIGGTISSTARRSEVSNVYDASVDTGSYALSGDSTVSLYSKYVAASASLGAGYLQQVKSNPSRTALITSNDEVSQLTNFELKLTEEPTSDRILGRISAWTCTTLYLTSRLPQIWKNFARKSVQGLSIYLFIFAFLGNSFYVLSILTSPNMSQSPSESRAFLIESIPYLLGSGGTLLFDVTIVFQIFFYGRASSRHIRRHSATSAAHSRSRAGSLAHHPHSQSHTQYPYQPQQQHASKLGGGNMPATAVRSGSVSSARGRSTSGVRRTVVGRSRSTSMLARRGRGEWEDDEGQGSNERAPLLRGDHNLGGPNTSTRDMEPEHDAEWGHVRKRRDASETGPEVAIERQHG